MKIATSIVSVILILNPLSISSVSGYEEVAIPDPCGLEVVVCKGEETPEEMIIRISREEGWNDPYTLIKIAKAESSLNCKAKNVNRNKSVDLGLFQINSIHNVPDDCRLDCECSIKWAIKTAKKQGYGPWKYSKHKWSK
jgi:hypothetical protein